MRYGSFFIDSLVDFVTEQSAVLSADYALLQYCMHLTAIMFIVQPFFRKEKFFNFFFFKFQMMHQTGCQ